MRFRFRAHMPGESADGEFFSSALFLAAFWKTIARDRPVSSRRLAGKDGEPGTLPGALV